VETLDETIMTGIIVTLETVTGEIRIETGATATGTPTKTVTITGETEIAIIMEETKIETITDETRGTRAATGIERKGGAHPPEVEEDIRPIIRSIAGSEVIRGAHQGEVALRDLQPVGQEVTNRARGALTRGGKPRIENQGIGMLSSRSRLQVQAKKSEKGFEENISKTRKMKYIVVLFSYTQN
jgi:hypothetical protein